MGKLILLIPFLVGCSFVNPNEWNDSRASQMCGVVEGTARGNLYTGEGELGGCKVVCSEDFPKGLQYSYESRFCRVNLNTGGSDE